MAFCFQKYHLYIHIYHHFIFDTHGCDVAFEELQHPLHLNFRHSVHYPPALSKYTIISEEASSTLDISWKSNQGDDRRIDAGIRLSLLCMEKKRCKKNDSKR